MPAFYTKVIELLDSITKKERDKPDYVKCDKYNHVVNMGCFGYHNPVISQKCLKCISLDRYNWLYIIIDCDLPTEEIDNIRSQGLYVHQSLLDVEAGLLPFNLINHIKDAIDDNTKYRGLVFATRNAEALEALTFYGGLKGYYPVYIYKGKIIDEYSILEKLFNTGYGKLLADIESNYKALNLK